MRSRARHRLPLILASIAALTTLTACGGSSDTPSAAAPSTDLPTADVVGTVTVDPAARALLPAGTTELTLGHSRSPGINQLPHAGEVPEGNPVGLDVDLRNALAKVLGVTWKEEIGTFNTIIPGVQSGKFQVGQGNFGVTKPRLEIVDFASYLEDGQAFLGSKASGLTKVTELTDLCGKTIATSPGSTFQQILEAKANDCAGQGKQPYKVQYFADQGPIYLGLQSGKVDVFFGPTLSLKYAESKIEGTKFLGQYSTSTVGFVTAKGSPIAPALVKGLNTLIERGQYKAIFDKWKVPDAGVAHSELNPAPRF